MVNAAEVNRSLQDFDAQHGECLRVEGVLLFEDGARREIHPMGVRQGPPEDPYQRAQAVKRFRETALDMKLRLFRETRIALHYQAQNALKGGDYAPPPPSAEQLAELKVLMAEVQRRRKAVEEAEKAVAENVPDAVRRMRESAERARAEAQKTLDELNRINV